MSNVVAAPGPGPDVVRDALQPTLRAGRRDAGRGTGRLRVEAARVGQGGLPD